MLEGRGDKRPQEAPKRAQEAPTRVQEASQKHPRAPKTHTKGTQEHPKGIQKAPKRHPGGTQEVSCLPVAIIIEGRFSYAKPYVNLTCINRNCRKS